MSAWFVYILRCRNGSLYTGITTDIQARVSTHNSGKGAKYTRAFRPVQLVYSQRMKTSTRARQREAEIKSWTKNAKEKLVKTKGLQ